MHSFKNRPRFFLNLSLPLLSLPALGASLLLLSSCQDQPVVRSATSAGRTTEGLELQHEDYREARSHFQTHLVRETPAPQPGDALHAPAGAVQVIYSPTMSLQAWLSPLPAGRLDVKRPAVLFLHGGFAMDTDDWEMSRPYRDAGFIVMMPVLRGENGQKGSYSMFYNEVSDVLEAASVLARVPGVDARHIYLAGHSVGGTLVQLCALTSSRFRAAASFSGAPDPISWSKGQPQVVPFDPSQIRGFQMRSSLAFATSFKCPTRLYYGDQEMWCDAPSRDTAQRAKEKGLDVEAVQVPGDHFSAVPEAMKRSIEFFQSQK